MAVRSVADSRYGQYKVALTHNRGYGREGKKNQR